jgi:hypothetical protein
MHAFSIAASLFSRPFSFFKFPNNKEIASDELFQGNRRAIGEYSDNHSPHLPVGACKF